VLVAVPRLVAGLEARAGGAAAGPEAWQDGALAVPGAAEGAPWRTLLTGEAVEPRRGPAGGAGLLRLADVFRSFPVALLAAPGLAASPPS
jgi:maltooligosyltrehalose synthase